MSRNMKTYWEKYYKTTPYWDIPWKGDNRWFLDEVLASTAVPAHGKVLDVGCGMGEKSCYLATLNFSVWGFDISPIAIKQAKAMATRLKNKPIFFTADARSLKTAKELRNMTFDLILDKLVSQFFSSEEKEIYLRQLITHALPKHTLLVLQVLGKEQVSDLSHEPVWVQEIAQTNDQVQKIYGKFFHCLKRDTQINAQGTQLDTYIMRA